MNHARAHRRSRAGGFTLVELMVVICIIGLISSIVALNVFVQKRRAMAERVRADVRIISHAISLYRLDHPGLPATLEELAPYVEGGVAAMRDPWNREYVYTVTDAGDPPYSIGSYGADGAPGGTREDADIFPLEEGRR